MILTIEGNILDVNQGIIVHQTNCSGGFGGGVAGQIARKYPHVRQEYFKLYYENQKQPNVSLLGTYQSVKATDALTIVNLFGQYEYRSSVKDKRVLTDYVAFERGLRKLNQDVPKDIPIYLPYGIGCGLANGNWNVVHKIISKVFKHRDNVFIVQLRG